MSQKKDATDTVPRMVLIEVWVSTNKVGSECQNEFEIEEEIWNNMTDKEREEECREVMWDMLDWGWGVAE